MNLTIDHQEEDIKGVKIMKLNMLVLEGDRGYEKLNDVIPISFQSYHISELFMHFLPKIDLDGSSKLVIYFKEKEESEAKYVCDNNFHVSWFYVDKNDLNNLKNLNKEMLNLYYLNIIADTFRYIAKQNNCNQEILTIIEETVQRVKDSEYRLTQKIKQLSRISPDKQFKANVYRHIDSQGELWYVEIEGKNNKIKKYDIMEKPSHISKVHFYKKSQWENDKFILLNKLGQVVITIKDFGDKI